MGHHGEALVDVGFARIGFRILQSKVREVDGKRWIVSNHDLDRVIARDGVRYGVEIKNQLGYIEQEEFGIKLRMCEHFGVRPMFIARMMTLPKVPSILVLSDRARRQGDARR